MIMTVFGKMVGNHDFMDLYKLINYIIVSHNISSSFQI